MPRLRLPVFPLPGAVLFPGMRLPLHIFEPRYRAMMGEAMARGQRIGMIQPIARSADAAGRPRLYRVGCVGYLSDIEALNDGRYNILLEGKERFTIVTELEVSTPFRQVEAELWEEREDEEALASVERAALEDEARKFADRVGYEVDWDGVSRLDDQSFVNGMAQVIPFDPASKQALLESDGLSLRAQLLTQMIQFASRGYDAGDGATMQ